MLISNEQFPPKNMSVALPLKTDYLLPTVVSVLLHLLIVIGLTLHINHRSAPIAVLPTPVDIIEAEAVDSEYLAALERAEQARLEQQRRLAEQRRLAAQRRQQQAAAKAAAAAKQAAEAAEQAKKAKQAEQERQRRAALKAEEEKLMQAKLAEAQQAEWEQLQAAERAQQLAAEQAAREQQRQQRLAEQNALYIQAIRHKVERHWIRPAAVEIGYTCSVFVQQIPGGEVISVAVEQCNGDASFERSVENAVYKASPLPEPPDPSLFQRRIRFNFVVKEI